MSHPLPQIFIEMFCIQECFKLFLLLGAITYSLPFFFLSYILKTVFEDCLFPRFPVFSSPHHIGIISNHTAMSVILKGTPFIWLVTHSISFLQPFLLSFPLLPVSLDYSSSNVS